MEMTTKFEITAELRPCYVDGKKALFHRWIDKETPIIRINAMLTEKALDRIKDKIKNGMIPPSGDVVLQKTVFGIVEYHDGTVAEVEPTSIIFADSMHDEYAFNERKINNEN
jgi:hypothetical protein